MKKTQIIELLQRIRRTKISFIAIITFITFGVALYTGIKWSEETLYKSMEADYDNLKLHDLEILFPLGITEEDVDEFRKDDSVTEAEGACITYQFFNCEDVLYQAKVESITEDIDILRVNEGRLPENEKEAAIDTSWAEKHNVGVGTRLDMFDETITITALVDTPRSLQIHANGVRYEASPINKSPVDVFMYMTKESFVNRMGMLVYAKAIIRSDALRNLQSMDEEYKTKSKELSEDLSPVIESLQAGSSATVFTRKNIPTIVSEGIVGELMGKLCSCFGIVFIVIGILVCYTTLSRIVYQEEVLTGTKKALGFYDREIKKSHLLYALIAAIIGATLGVVISVVGVQPLLVNAMGENFRYSGIHTSFSLKDTVVLFLIEIIVMLLAALLACTKSLKRDPLSLLLGAEPPSAKRHLIERTRFFKKLPLLFKCVIKNAYIDRRRVIGTLIGIVGCTALTVSSISFYLSVLPCLDKQFSELQRYDKIVYFISGDDKAADEISKVLDKEAEQYEKVGAFKGAIISAEEKSNAADLLVIDIDEDSMMTFRKTDGTPVSNENGALVACAYANQHGFSDGGTLTFRNTSGKDYTVPVEGGFENYLQYTMVTMSSKVYESVFEEPFEQNAFLVKSDSLSAEELAKKLRGIEGYTYTQDFYKDAMITQSVINIVVTAIMCLYIVVSVLIAIFVILDILQMFVTEKKRELITLVINGYSIKYAKKYISLDTYFLTIVGIVIGIVAGILLGAWDISSTESEACYFFHDISITACLIGSAVTAILVKIMTTIAQKRIDKFELSDINEL